MNTSNLKIKSTNNYKVAKYAERENYYDVAVSRYYYYLYQNLIVYILKNYTDFEVPKDKESHSYTIDFLTEEFFSIGFTWSELTDFKLMTQLRTQRNASEYKEIKIDSEGKYKSRFKDSFDIIEELLKKKSIIEG